ncbi:aminotransferase class III-fold pyridoxal phosphate-dependent enzyme [Streptomyces sp. NPDC058417]|uniref:aminotransferase class III-fold pyridoxal phosphate-dependent enzyme n=1 Tax=unclassified Streptomyces TaxID=2593676 RepID=UPI00365AEF9A
MVAVGATAIATSAATAAPATLPAGRSDRGEAAVTVRPAEGSAPAAASPPREHAPRGAASRRQPVREPAARTYARSLPVVPVRARGMTVEAADGRRYLDCLSGAGTLALGHNHPVVLEAVRRAVDSGAPLHALDLATPLRDTFVTELLQTLPAALADRARVRFCGPSGNDAVEAAVDLVRAATGRTDVLSLTGRSAADTDSANSAELAARWAQSAVDEAEPGDDALAGALLEPVLGDGLALAPDTWLRRMRRVTSARSVPLIVDETQTGVGRTGTYWAVEHSGVTPDVLIVSGALGGSLPLAAVVHREELDAGRPGARPGLVQANQLALAAGAATLAHVRVNRLADRAANVGAAMISQLRHTTAELHSVAEIRGRGLMIGVELVSPEDEATRGHDSDARRGEESPRTGQDARTGKGSARHDESSGRACRSDEARGGRPQRNGSVGLGDGGNDSDAARQSGRTGRADDLGARREAESRLAATAAEATVVQRSPTASTRLAAAVRRECLHRGLIVGLGGSGMNVIRLLPPLTITDEQMTAVLDRLTDALDAASHPRSHSVSP